MDQPPTGDATPFPTPLPAERETPAFQVGEHVRVRELYPIGHYRVPRYVRGRAGIVEAVIHPRAVNNEEEGFGRNAGSKRHYYRVAFPMHILWPGYCGSTGDGLRIEIFENWLRRD
jgi:nitrile hydratase